MGDKRWEMGDGIWEMGDGRWEMGGGRWEMGDGGQEVVGLLVILVFWEAPMIERQREQGQLKGNMKE